MIPSALLFSWNQIKFRPIHCPCAGPLAQPRPLRHLFVAVGTHRASDEHGIDPTGAARGSGASIYMSLGSFFEIFGIFTIFLF